MELQEGSHCGECGAERLGIRECTSCNLANLRGATCEACNRPTTLPYPTAAGRCACSEPGAFSSAYCTVCGGLTFNKKFLTDIFFDAAPKPQKTPLSTRGNGEDSMRGQDFFVDQMATDISAAKPFSLGPQDLVNEHATLCKNIWKLFDGKVGAPWRNLGNLTLRFPWMPKRRLLTAHDVLVGGKCFKVRTGSPKNVGKKSPTSSTSLKRLAVGPSNYGTR